MASMKGKYFEKPKLLSQKIQDLIDEVEQLPVFGEGAGPKPEATESKVAENSVPKQAQQAPAKQQKQEKKQKAKKQKKGNNGASGGDGNSEFSEIGQCEFVVGKIVEIDVHPNADKMYVEMIDIGEDKPRQIVSGLKDFVPIDEMRDSLVVVFKNLKPSPLRDVMSFGMVLAASNAEHTKVELVRPAAGSKVGERVVLESDDFSAFTPAESIKAKKKNSCWMKSKDFLKTDDNMQASFKGIPFVTSQGPLKVQSLANASIS